MTRSRCIILRNAWLPGASPGTDKGLQKASLEFRSKGVPRWFKRDPRAVLYVTRIRSLSSFSLPSIVLATFLSFPAFPAPWTESLIVFYVTGGSAQPLASVCTFELEGTWILDVGQWNKDNSFCLVKRKKKKRKERKKGKIMGMRCLKGEDPKRLENIRGR